MRARYLDRIHRVHHRVLQDARHGSGCHVGRHGDMRRQALVVAVAVVVVFARDRRHGGRRRIRAQLHALPRSLGLPCKERQRALREVSAAWTTTTPSLLTGVPAPVWRHPLGAWLRWTRTNRCSYTRHSDGLLGWGGQWKVSVVDSSDTSLRCCASLLASGFEWVWQMCNRSVPSWID